MTFQLLILLMEQCLRRYQSVMAKITKKLLDMKKFNDSPENKNKSFSIDECLEHFTDQEQLDEHNRWICNFCGLKNRALTKTELWKTPKIMVIHFKRFIFNAYGIVTNKITNNVDYPIYDSKILKTDGSVLRSLGFKTLHGSV